MSGGTSSKSPTDRREWRQRPTAERIAYANKLLVLHPRFREAVALLERCHQSSKQAGEPVCGAILGSSGVGKTSVVDHYRRLHPPFPFFASGLVPEVQRLLHYVCRPMPAPKASRPTCSWPWVIPPGAAARWRV